MNRWINEEIVKASCNYFDHKMVFKKSFHVSFGQLFLGKFQFNFLAPKILYSFKMCFCFDQLNGKMVNRLLEKTVIYNNNKYNNNKFVDFIQNYFKVVYNLVLEMFFFNHFLKCFSFMWLLTNKEINMILFSNYPNFNILYLDLLILYPSVIPSFF